MLYIFVVCVCLSLITGVLGFHDVLRQGLPIVHGLFGLFMAVWIAVLLIVPLRAVWPRLRLPPYRES